MSSFHDNLRWRRARQAYFAPVASEPDNADARDSDHVPLLKRLGPGLITGAADDDPSGIATYSQAGAQFGYSLLWSALVTTPLMIGIQIVSARLGRVTGHGLAANIRERFPKPVLAFIVSLLLVANTFNIAADLGAMGDALQLLIGGNSSVYIVLFALVSLTLQIFIPFPRYAPILKWLTLALFAYVGTVMVVHFPLREALAGTLRPNVSFDEGYFSVLVAVLGTTISPYLFFWQAAQEMEDADALDGAPHTPQEVRHHLRRIKFDTAVGMAFSNAIAFFIILSTAATLHAAGVHGIQTSAQAAEALRPLAGDLAFLMFGLGIIGTGMLAVPVLAGSAAYAVAEAAGWHGSLSLRLEAGEGRGFYGVIAVATLGGVLLCFTPTDPVQELFWAAVINGVIAVPIMSVMMLLASSPRVMGANVIGRRLRVAGWLATAVMAATVLAMLVTG